MARETERMPPRNTTSQWLMNCRDGHGEGGACDYRERHLLPCSPFQIMPWDQLLKRRSTVSCIVL